MMAERPAKPRGDMPRELLLVGLVLFPWVFAVEQQSAIFVLRGRLPAWLAIWFALRAVMSMETLSQYYALANIASKG